MKISVPSIDSLTGIKVLSLILIFYQHSAMPTLPLGLGSRMCELLFVISGFLVGYNKKNREFPCTYKTGFDYVVSKLIVVYPLHVIITLIRCILEYKSFSTLTGWIKLFLSLLLVTSWSPHEDVFFCLNGSSWFLSALLFCYFLSPLFIRIMKTKHTKLFFIAVFLLRLLLDIIPEYTALRFLELHTHVNPFVRSLEFLMGMMLVPGYCNIKKKLMDFPEKQKIILFTFLEIASLCISILLMYIFCDIWPKTLYVLLFCFFVFIFSFNEGLLSAFFSLSVFKKFNTIQFEFYLSHTTFLTCCSYLLMRITYPDDSIIFTAICTLLEFCILSVICYIYKKWFKPVFSKIMTSFTGRIYHSIEL